MGARRLLRAARSATLATVEDGQPFASLVTPAPAPDLSLLMLLSGLSPHTRHLRADPRCGLMVAGPRHGRQPADRAAAERDRASPRPSDDPALKARWVARHPYAAFYADLAGLPRAAAAAGRPGSSSAASAARTG